MWRLVRKLLRQLDLLILELQLSHKQQYILKQLQLPQLLKLQMPSLSSASPLRFTDPPFKSKASRISWSRFRTKIWQISLTTLPSRYQKMNSQRESLALRTVPSMLITSELAWCSRASLNSKRVYWIASINQFWHKSIYRKHIRSSLTQCLIIAICSLRVKMDALKKSCK